MSRPLRHQIVILNLAILVPVIAAIVWSARQTYQEQISHLQAECRAVASIVVVYLERGVDARGAQAVLETVPLPDGSVITITDDHGTVLARSRDPERYVGKSVENGALPARTVPESQILHGLDGVERVFANTVYQRGPWLVSVGVPTSVAFERVLPIYRRNAAIAIALTVFTFLLQFFAVRRYSRAFSHLAAGSTRVAAGDFTTPKREPMPSLELDHLQTAFVEMVGKLREANAALASQVAEERRIREELELLQRQVIRQERLAAIGVLVSGVAHELNNPLQAILGFAELLQSREDLPPETRLELELMQKESVRASAIIRNLSRFGRQQTSDPTLVRLHDVVASVMELRQRKLEESHIRVQIEDRGVLPVLAVFTELQQVVLNFLINAEQAVMHGVQPRRIFIRTLDVGDRARLEVQDTGPGVPPEHEAKLFQPFFTTKAVGEGTGLGLSISYGIIQSHSGTIGYRPAPGGGAVFYFELPVARVGASPLPVR